MKLYRYPLLLLAVVIVIVVTVGVLKSRARQAERVGSGNNEIIHYVNQEPVGWVFGRLVGVRSDVYSRP